MKSTLASFILVLGILLLTACASSGVVKTGPNTYMIANSEWGFTSGGYQKAKAIGEADNYCASLGREIQVIGSKGHGVELGKVPSAEVKFKCLPKSVPQASSRSSH